MERKEKFYIFLDIDGVLWDWDWRLKQIDNGKIKNKSMILDFNPKSISSLDNLIDKLNNKFDTNLVISSTWRVDLDSTKEILKNNGLKYNGNIYATPFSITPHKRGEEILSFLEDKTDYDFLIIDDEDFDFKLHFDKNKIIKTSLLDNSLSSKHTEKWLEENINFSDYEIDKEKE